jgi:hypothetical protein
LVSDVLERRPERELFNVDDSVASDACGQTPATTNALWSTWIPTSRPTVKVDAANLLHVDGSVGL